MQTNAQVVPSHHGVHQPRAAPSRTPLPITPSKTSLKQSRLPICIYSQHRNAVCLLARRPACMCSVVTHAGTRRKQEQATRSRSTTTRVCDTWRPRARHVPVLPSTGTGSFSAASQTPAVLQHRCLPSNVFVRALCERSQATLAVMPGLPRTATASPKTDTCGRHRPMALGEGGRTGGAQCSSHAQHAAATRHVAWHPSRKSLLGKRKEYLTAVARW